MYEDDDTVQTYSFTHDAFGNALSASVGDRTLATYEYEAGNGYLKKQTYGNGDEIIFTYDDLGRTKTVTYDDGTTVTYIYNGEGAVYSITEEQGTNTTRYLYTYDSIGRLIGCEKKVNGETVLRTYQEFNEHNQQTHYGYQMGDESYSESYTYNSDGTLNQIAGSNGRTVTLGYDGLQRLSSKTVKQGDTTVVSYAYSYRDISETATTTQIASVQVTAANTTTSYAYTYDSSGNILSVSDGTNTTSYVYDSMNQLLRENNQAANKTWVWTYDYAGNIQSKSEYAYTTGELGEAVDTVSYGYTDENWNDLLTSYDGHTITYDEIGNPLSDGTWSYTWENGRQLASMTNGTTTWNYEYNADGLRTSRTDGTTTYKYVYNGSQLVQMSVGNDVLYFTSDTVTYNNTVYYYVSNLQGDIVAILNSSGTAVVQYTYDAWGNVLSIDGTMSDTLGQLNPLRYRGYVFDSETELYYLQSRYYDPEVGRFLNADAFISTGQSILGNDMFAYCRNNPVNRKDASATEDVCATDFNQDNNPLNDLGSPSGGGGGGDRGLGVKSSYYTSQKVQAYDWKWQNSSYNQNAGSSNATAGQQGTSIDAFDSFIDDPTSVVGKTEAEMGELLGEEWTHGTYGSSGTGWKYIYGDKLVAYHPGGGRHVGSYYKLSSAKYGKIKVVGPDYIPIPGDSAKIIWCV